jgi:L-lysine 6-transaminase
MGVAPDVVVFGKKTQICGVYASGRIDEVPDNVFRMSSRINSTWGGSLVDMVRCRRFIEIIEREQMGPHIAALGERLVAGLRVLAADREVIGNVRGVGSLVACTLPSAEERDAMLERTFANELLVLPSGPKSIRFRLPFVMDAGHIDEVLNRVEASLP